MLCLFGGNVIAGPNDTQTEIQKYIKDLEKDDFPVRKEAVEALSKIGTPAMPELTKKLGWPFMTSCGHAAQVMVNIGKPAVPALIEALGNKDNLVRTNAAWAIGQIGADAVEAGPTLVALLKDNDEQVRAEAAAALGSVGYKKGEAVAGLINLLKDNAGTVRMNAASSLGQMENDAVSAVPNLIVAIKDENIGVREKVIEALKKIGTPEALQIAQDKKTNLTQEKAIEIAKEYALKKGEDLKQYAAPNARFDENRRVWHVYFEMDPPRIGGMFGVEVDDISGKAINLLYGE
jgi:HEAT repeat protein